MFIKQHGSILKCSNNFTGPYSLTGPGEIGAFIQIKETNTLLCMVMIAIMS